MVFGFETEHMSDSEEMRYHLPNACSLCPRASGSESRASTRKQMSSLSWKGVRRVVAQRNWEPGQLVRMGVTGEAYQG